MTEYRRVDKRQARKLYDAGRTMVMSLERPECELGEVVDWYGITTLTKEQSGMTFDQLVADGLQWKHRYPGSRGLVWYTRHNLL